MIQDWNEYVKRPYEESCIREDPKEKAAAERRERKERKLELKKVREKAEKERKKEHEAWLERRRQRFRMEAERDGRVRAAAGKPVPGAWRTAGREDGW